MDGGTGTDAIERGGEAWRRVLVNGAVSWVITLAGNLSAYLAYRPVAPAALVNGWGLFVAGLLAFWAALMVGAIAARHRRSVVDPRLRTQRLILEIWTWLTVLGVIWLLMPYGTPALQLVTLLFVTCYAATTAISSADQPNTLIFRVAVVIGSIAAVSVVERLPYWPFVVIFLGVFGLSLFALAQLFERNLSNLRAARHSAEAERDARTRFLASASHDLSQPIQAARLFVDQVLRAPDPQVAARAAADARLAFDAVERLIRQILDHLRLETGELKPQIDAVELAPILERIVTQFGPIAELGGVRLTSRPGRGRALGDAALIERCLGNLVDNALRHSGAGRGLITSRSSRGRQRLYVIDDGHGVDQAQTAELFAEAPAGFAFRGRTEGGFGIGLASVRRATELMGGSAGLDPRWRNGAAFYLDLPAA